MKTAEIGNSGFLKKIYLAFFRFVTKQNTEMLNFHG